MDVTAWLPKAGGEDATAALHPGHTAGPGQDHAQAITEQQDFARSCQDYTGPVAGRFYPPCQAANGGQLPPLAWPASPVPQDLIPQETLSSRQAVINWCLGLFIQGAHWPLAVPRQILCDINSGATLQEWVTAQMIQIMSI